MTKVKCEIHNTFKCFLLRTLFEANEHMKLSLPFERNLPPFHFEQCLKMQKMTTTIKREMYKFYVNNHFTTAKTIQYFSGSLFALSKVRR